LCKTDHYNGFGRREVRLILLDILALLRLKIGDFRQIELTGATTGMAKRSETSCGCPRPTGGGHATVAGEELRKIPQFSAD
jgi:hypothetical protein